MCVKTVKNFLWLSWRNVLTFLAPGVWPKRALAREAGAGVYELTINVPERGVYFDLRRR